ncbi:hypothetical protein JYU34_013642 [Plutella xylostella]|uniref:Uncharacterized protein n=1 Tax=Plutella xylostella TaxID=51655 RepID=A0ABQ7QAA5_PLUXY|nr:hypothetical protein JYU34_013642 [Plutella xylostella]
MQLGSPTDCPTKILALSAKAILLPVAGLAILGAAAALVSNPVLLQLGVVSGRKRRDTTGLGDEQDTTNWIHKPDFRTQPEIANRKDWETETAWGNGRFQKASLDKKNGSNKKPLLKGLPIRQSTIEAVSLDAQGYDSISDSDVNFVPVPLKLRKGYRKHVP